MATPDWNAFLAGAWGGSPEVNSDAFALIQAASNVVIGQNPPYTLQDFFSMYPKFAGQPLISGTASPLGSFTAGSGDFTIDNPAGVAIGQPIAGVAIPDNTFVSAISGSTVSMTNPATESVANSPVVIWNATPVPIPALLAFIALASSHLVQARWLDTWKFAMGLFVAHFATLFARADANVNSNARQIASQGVAGGIQISKSAGDVSVAYATLQGIENWAAWNLTSYGQQLATFAKVIGMGPMMLY